MAQDQIPEHINSGDAQGFPPGQSGRSLSDTSRNWEWATSAAVASGEDAIVTMNGSKRGKRSALVMGAFLLLDASEMADYPSMSTMRNQAEPTTMSASGTAMDTLANLSEMVSDGVRPSMRYLGLMVFGILTMGFSLRMATIWMVELATRRAKKGKTAWVDIASIDVADTPSVSTLPTPANSNDVRRVNGPITTCSSGPTSGESSDDDAVMSTPCRSSSAISDDNYLRPTSTASCKKIACVETDLALGDSTVVKYDNVATLKVGRAEVGLCEKHYRQYIERMGDV